jgi:hypothetical protein
MVLLALAVPTATLQWTILPNLRCHGELSQTHNISSTSACEALCDGTPSCSVVSYCPFSGAADCANNTGGPEPGTCWLYPIAVLPCSATQAQGWTSAYKPAPSPTPTPTPPPDWAARIAAGQMAFSPLPPAYIGEGFYPVVGNGFLALEMGPFVQAFENTWPWRDAGSLKLSGVYNGRNYSSPSHRAQLPNPCRVSLAAAPGGNFSTVGAAMDWELGIFYNRTLVSGLPGCMQPTTVEFRAYAHRALRELLVCEVSAASATGDASWAGCTVPVEWPVSPASPDADLQESHPLPPAAVYSGSTLLAEEEGFPLRALALAFDAWAAASPTSLAFTPAAPTLTVCAVARSDLDVARGASPSAVAQAATATWQAYSAQGSAALLASHASAARAMWAGGGVELSGNASLAAVVNASLHDIVASLRGDWNWSTSPGGLATGGYSGHSFWDMETWMFPVLAVLRPDLARVAAQYRLDRLGASVANSASLNQSGSQYAWESASTGLWASPWRDADFKEIHLDSDIPLAWRKFYYATGDEEFLRAAWPSLNATCTFWECRLTRSDSPPGGPGGAPGYPPGCYSKAGVGNWTARQVITPDERSGVIDDSVYTNAGAGQTLGWCLEAASILGIPAASLPPLWADMAARPHLPLDASLYPGGPVHPQNKGYHGQVINQADVALLQYPLDLDFGQEQNRRDLDYYAARTDFSGMFTGDSCALPSRAHWHPPPPHPPPLPTLRSLVPHPHTHTRCAWAKTHAHTRTHLFLPPSPFQPTPAPTWHWAIAAQQTPKLA